MGDGQHGWAAAEWIMMIRNLFVREEGDSLVLGAGIFPEWLKPEKSVGFGPTPTPYGNVALQARAGDNALIVYLDIDWKKDGSVPKEMVLAIPGYSHYSIPDFSQQTFTLERANT